LSEGLSFEQKRTERGVIYMTSEEQSLSQWIQDTAWYNNFCASRAESGLLVSVEEPFPASCCNPAW